MPEFSEQPLPPVLPPKIDRVDFDRLIQEAKTLQPTYPPDYDPKHSNEMAELVRFIDYDLMEEVLSPDAFRASLEESKALQTQIPDLEKTGHLLEFPEHSAGPETGSKELYEIYQNLMGKIQETDEGGLFTIKMYGELREMRPGLRYSVDEYVKILFRQDPDGSYTPCIYLNEENIKEFSKNTGNNPEQTVKNMLSYVDELVKTPRELTENEQSEKDEKELNKIASTLFGVKSLVDPKLGVEGLFLVGTIRDLGEEVGIQQLKTLLEKNFGGRDLRELTPKEISEITKQLTPLEESENE